MFQKNLLMDSACAFVIGLGLVAGTPVSAQDNIPTDDMEIAQGDGMPDEALPDVASAVKLDVASEVKPEAQPKAPTAPDALKTDETVKTADDAVATITAEGDFVVPTYLLPIEPATGADDILNAQNDVETHEKIVTQTETFTQELPVVRSVGMRFVPSGVKVIQPQQTPVAMIAVEEPAAEPADVVGADRTAAVAPADDDTVASKPVLLAVSDGQGQAADAVKKPLLLPLAPINEIKKDIEGTLALPKRHLVPSDYADKIVSALEKNEPAPLVMPHEVKVSFYPNATEFSGQSIKWIKAFSLVTISDPRLLMDVRVSTQNPEIQARRLALIKNVLLKNGLSVHQIQITYVNRPTDTLVLRNIVKPETYEIIQEKGTKAKKTKKW